MPRVSSNLSPKMSREGRCYHNFFRRVQTGARQFSFDFGDFGGSGGTLGTLWGGTGTEAPCFVEFRWDFRAILETRGSPWAPMGVPVAPLRHPLHDFCDVFL